MTITLTDTYRHLDGTPGTGHVLVRSVTGFHDTQGTVIPTWVAYPLDASGAVTITITADLEHADPGPQWLQIIEDVDCRHGAWEIGPDVLFATPDPTITLGDVRQLPALGDAPRYVPAPGPQGPQGTQGVKGDPGHDAQLPAGSDGQVLQYSSGQWSASDNLMSALNRTDALQDQINNLQGSTAIGWDPAATYPALSLVEHNGDLWIARTGTAAGEEPGVDHKWDPATIPSIYSRTKHWRPPQPADPADTGKVLTAQGGDAVWAANQAAQVTASDPTTGQLAIGGVEIGDTNWRDVTADLLHGWTASELRVRRTGSIVHVQMTLGDAAAATDDDLYSLPTGFRIGHTSQVLFAFTSATGGPKAANIGYGVSHRVPRGGCPHRPGLWDPPRALHRVLPHHRPLAHHSPRHPCIRRPHAHRPDSPAVRRRNHPAAGHRRGGRGARHRRGDPRLRRRRRQDRAA